MRLIKSIFLPMFVMPYIIVAQTNVISGKITDEKNNPLAYANIYIENSVDGASSSEYGYFKFNTKKQGRVTLIASMIGYSNYRIEKDATELVDFTIILKEDTKDLDEVIVRVGNFIIKGTSSIEKKGSIDVATTAGSEGDLLKAISLLPGAQVTGSDGRLLVRGGSSNESQIYIDDMHVLSPYAASAPNHQARSRYSPFFFSGINFSMGGFSSEYSQSLSSILPLYTKDKAKDSRLGASLMNVSLGGGGTQAWDKSSLSFNLDYTTLDWYNKIFYPSQNKLWEKTMQSYSLQKQFRYSPNKNTHFKTYYTFDKTNYKRNETPAYGNTRLMDFYENNLYLNTTFRTRTHSGINYFAGVAYGWFDRSILGAIVLNDKLKETESELHLKTKTSKRFSNFYRLELGAENFIKNYRLNYENIEKANSKFNHTITGIYLSNDFNITHNILLNTSMRGEHTSSNRSFAILPRLALSYKLNDFVLSGVIGRYQQLSSNKYLVYNEKLSNERNWQYQLGIYYQKNQSIFRAEIYYKNYEKLTTNQSAYQYSSVGYGFSRGIDLFFNNQLFLNHWDYILSYTFNDTKRKYLNYPYKVQPHFVTKHNTSLSLRYTNLTKLRSIVGLTNRWASGRPYDNPNEDSFMNGRTSFYHTIDISWSILAHKKLIIYASVSNIFNRKNIYGYTYNTQTNNQTTYDRKAIILEQAQAFYIGAFITLGKNAAYEATHF